MRYVSDDPSMPDEVFSRRLSVSEANHMIRPLQNEEIKNVMFSIGNYKAPGSDGFSSKFFKASWDIVGRDVEIAIHNFFYRGNLPKNLNHTLICLLPKSVNASRVTDYRPIACCTVLYKCISKLIVNRMKDSLDSLIDKAQSAFIPGRRITDNILMAHELVSRYQTTSGPPTERGISPGNFIKTEKEQNHTKSNQQEKLRQLWLTNQAIRSQKRQREMHQKSRSGLAPSLEKSDIYFGNVPPNIKEVILECLPFKLGSFPVRYLGVPLSQARLKICDYALLIANVKGRILNWKSKFLSFGGQRQLIISVLQSLQLYWMSVFLFSSGLIHDLESIFRKFLWAPREVPRGRCRLSWDMVCRPLESGGLGIKRLSTWNRALLAKHVWDIVRHRDFFVAFISYRFVHSCGFSTFTTIRDLIMSWNGVWPDDWCSRFAVIHNSPLPLLNDSVCDRVPWGEDRNACSDFTRRLPTQDRFLWKDEPPELKCSLCGQCMDSHVHLFFQCQYAHEVWNSILHITDLRDMPSMWDHILVVLSDSRRHSKSLKQKLAVAASVYYIWQERNRRLFTEDRRTTLQLIKVILDSISIRADWLARWPMLNVG
ncbi:uncharacterized protein LOC112511401 [Cynara cardunculus var. scolymus]|uniref:uncharacterized protein LOC112511401 n=1 Tax=Cynara cardunculus var. scolymus TaxID=59895 RepID=UPI000D62618B|nr:uncharacterized protein LOC112511401 [Cynara cardunculus var. scolymus]